MIVGLLRDGLLRRGEAAALRWGDLADADDGAGVITARRSKTDTDGAGAVLWISAPTMRDIAAWRERLSFFGADVGSEAPLVGLAAPSIARRLAAAGEAAGLPDRLSGPSGRVGMAQDLVRHGLDLAATMQSVVSGGREPPPPALLEPYVTVSRHTAPTVRRGVEARRCQ